MNPYGVLDIEAVGEPFDGRLLCIGWDGKAYAPGDIERPGPLNGLGDPGITKVVFTKYDHRWLNLHGLPVAGPVHDVQVMAWLLDEAQELSLEGCALRYCGIEMDKRIYQVGGRVMFRRDDGAGVPLAEAPQAELLAYNRRDLAATDALYQKLWTELEDAGLLDYFLGELAPFTATLVRMEAAGVPVDIPGAQALAAQLSEEIDQLEDELRAEGGLPRDFNLGSAQQLGQYLYQEAFSIVGRIRKGDPEPEGFVPARAGRVYVHGTYELEGRGLPVKARTDSGQPSTAAPKLRSYYQSDPWVCKLLELKQRQTIVNSFLSNFPKLAHGGRLYGRFNQTGTVTGRLSSNSPNLQNIPARTELGHRVRELFRAPAGAVFVHGDYSQLEPRLMAHWSADPVLLSTFHNGEDLYRNTAARIFGGDVTDTQRGICKVLMLALGYGAGARKLAQILTENGYPTSETVAGSYLGELRRVYRVFFSWRETVITMAGVRGYVTTLAGRRRRLSTTPGVGDHWKTTTLTETQAVNAVIQGSAADVVARVMVAADADHPRLRLLAQVHDELLWQAPEGEVSAWDLYSVQKTAERAHGFRLAVPLVFEPRVVQTWAEGKD